MFPSHSCSMQLSASATIFSTFQRQQTDSMWFACASDCWKSATSGCKSSEIVIVWSLLRKLAIWLVIGKADAGCEHEREIQCVCEPNFKITARTRICRHISSIMCVLFRTHCQGGYASQLNFYPFCSINKILVWRNKNFMAVATFIWKILEKAARRGNKNIRFII